MPRGLYKFNRLAFGVKVEPAIFQQVMDAMLGDLDLATAYLDDILIASISVTEHTKHIMCVFDKLQKYGFKVKEVKWDFFLAGIKYLGHITLVYKNKFFVCGKNGDRCFLLI